MSRLEHTRVCTFISILSSFECFCMQSPEPRKNFASSAAGLIPSLDHARCVTTPCVIFSFPSTEGRDLMLTVGGLMHQSDGHSYSVKPNKEQVGFGADESGIVRPRKQVFSIVGHSKSGRPCACFLAGQKKGVGVMTLCSASEQKKTSNC